MSGKSDFLERLRSGKILLSDGAWSTELQRHGLGVGACPEEWNISQPDVVRGVTNSYYEAGADMGQTNTFNGNLFRLRERGFGKRVKEFNKAGAALAKQAAQAHNGFTVGDVGPTGELIEPRGLVNRDEMYRAYRDQMEALLEGGGRRCRGGSAGRVGRAAHRHRARSDHG